MAIATTPIPQLRQFTPGRARAGPIIVAVGGSNPESALLAARAIAIRSGAGVQAVAVLEPLPVYLGGEPMGAAMSYGYDDARKIDALEQLAARIRADVGSQPEWTIQVAEGDAAHAIAHAAHECHAPLIVMGMGRHRRIDRFLGLETTLRTVHRARCPVLAVGPSFEMAKRVIIATDFTPASARAAEAVVPLLDPEATVTLLHVWQPSHFKAVDRLVAADMHYDSALSGRFERLVELLGLPSSMTVETTTREGDPATEILRYAHEVNADLIVAGRRSLHSLQRMLSDSVTASLLRSAVCSVLVTPEPQFADVDRLMLRLTGTSTASHPAEWRVQLENFSARHRGRQVAVELDDEALGAQMQAIGYPLLGATYDQHDHRVELMLGGEDGRAHMTHSIADVSAVTIVADIHGNDLGLCITHGDGQTLLTFSERLP
jgi:nucleotide-binding universal stress UspA family protein